ncbi:pseudouridine synthase [Novilysobacter arseniciresistens]|uniref:pseudouridine synthase n=1 Tax=Novilysobacter arseniciresistens TaxID=1385522 RepID=UPI00068DC8F3|nr:pseudouridine synthase [Lysobacter arseniciresistens]
MTSNPPPDAVPASRLQLPPGPWTTLLEGLCARFPRVSRERWLDRFARARVTDARGVALAPDAAYRTGLEVRYFREVAHEPRIPFEEAVLHVDRDLVVADKPHFLPVMPAGAFVTETLLGRLVRRLGNPDLVPLHRIDRGTAGLVMFSANPGTRAAYQALFRERRIDKAYEALAPPLPGRSFPLVRRSRLERGEPFFRMGEVAGEPNSESRIDVLERGDACWRYALQPVSGRKHQLRVHMAALGAAIVGDPFYPRLREQGEDDPARPLQLLARSLSFDDPLSGKARHFKSGLSLEWRGDAGVVDAGLL